MADASHHHRTRTRRTASSSAPSPDACCSSTRSVTCSGRASTSSSASSPRPSEARSGSPSRSGVTVAAITGAAYAELVTKYPQAAGASLYVNKAFGNRPLTFLITVSFLAASMAASGSLAVGFASYFDDPVVRSAGAAGRRWSSWRCSSSSTSSASPSRCVMNMLMTFVEVAGLLIVLVIGICLHLPRATPTSVC